MFCFVFVFPTGEPSEMTMGRVLHFLCLLHFLEIVLRQLLAPPSETGLVLALVVDLQAGKVRHSVSFGRKQIFSCSGLPNTGLNLLLCGDTWGIMNHVCQLHWSSG